MSTRSRFVLLAPFLTLIGCGSGSETGVTEQITWHEHVAPLVASHCSSCHEAGGSGPFALDNYESAKGLAGAMIAAVEAGTMPPWSAHDTENCHPLRPWKDDLRLSAEEIANLRTWVDTGTLEGDPAKAAPLPERPELQLKSPTKSLPFAAGYTVDGASDDFQCFVLDPGNTQRVWLTAAQVRPGNTKVDHHALVYLDSLGSTAALADQDGRFPCFGLPDAKGFLFSAWAPGAVPTRMPETSGMPMDPGAKILVQMHYHPTGQGPEFDQSTIDLEWTTTPPVWEAALALVGNNSKLRSDGTGLQPGPNDTNGIAEFRIPANATGHTETMFYRQEIPLALPIFGVGTHMHYVGTDMQIQFTSHAEETNECLVQTPNWNFNWQRLYAFDTPIADYPVIRPGDELTMRCTYDNSLKNRFVGQALEQQGLKQPIDVVLGEQTLNEMCLGVFGILAPPGALDQIF
ncbi:MAG TPA: hypothetical protein PK156_12685 [Polyangium sp.]|nr:hypothetical protein [Polyangium sp.]